MSKKNSIDVEVPVPPTVLAAVRVAEHTAKAAEAIDNAALAALHFEAAVAWANAGAVAARLEARIALANLAHKSAPAISLGGAVAESPQEVAERLADALRSGASRVKGNAR